ncbi:MAG: hypothetical protein ACK44W_13900, partial [Planctomycetota bacterium]
MFPKLFEIPLFGNLPTSWPVFLVIVAGVAAAAVLGAFAGRRFLDALSEDRFRRWRRWIFTVLGAGFLIQGVALLAG